MHLKLNTIKSKMLVYILGVLCALFVILSVIIISLVSSEQKDISYRSTLETAKKIATEINSDIESYDSGLRAYNRAITNYTSRNRHEVSMMAKSYFLDNDQFAGVFTVFEPNAFDGNDANFVNNEENPGNESGRFTTYWNKLKGHVELKRSTDKSYAEGDYYQIPKKTCKEVILEPYLYDGVLMISMVHPIMRNGQFAGVTGLDISIDYLDKYISRLKVLESGYVELVSTEGVYMASNNKEYEGKKSIFKAAEELKYDGLKEAAEKLKNGESGFISTYDPVRGEDVTLFYAPVKKAGWGVIVNVPNQEILAGVYSLRNTLIVIEIIFMLILAVMIYFVSIKITVPVKKLTDLVTELSKGHVKYRSDIKSDDEIGLMSDHLNSFANQLEKMSDEMYKISQGDVSVHVESNSENDMIAPALNAIPDVLRELIAETDRLGKAAVEGNLNIRGNSEKFRGGYKRIVEGVNGTLDAIVEPLEESKEILTIMATGNLTVRMKGDYAGDYKIIKDSINKFAESMNAALTEVNEAVQATASAASEISSSSEQMAAGSQEQSQQTTEVAGAVEQLSSTIYENTKGASLAAEKLKNANIKAAEGGKIVEKTIEGMDTISVVVTEASETVEKLGNSSNQIGDIIQVIDDIADQTNLLALNAAIEAARAGEQGRGFAVVADEVRKLAERTIKATKEIAEMINNIQSDTENAVTAIRKGTEEVEKGKAFAYKSGDALNEIIEDINICADIVMQAVSANEEMSSGAEQISRNMEGISSVTQQSAAGSGQIARAAEDLSRLTVNLQNLISKFSLDGMGNDRMAAYADTYAVKTYN